jgi:hypothetical protein
VLLQGFGVSPAAQRVYLALLRDEADDSAGLLARVEVSDIELAEVLGELSALGLSGPVDEDTGLPTVVPPDQAMELLIAREEAEIEQRRRLLHDSRASIPSLVDEFVSRRRTTVSSEVELFTESALVRSRIFQLTKAATRSAWSIHPGPALTERAVAAALPLDRDLAARGLDCRMIVESSSLGPAYWNDYLAELVSLGHQIRVVHSVSQRCLVLDGEWALVPTVGARSTGAYVLRNASLLGPVLAYFEEVWRGAEPFLDLTLLPEGTLSEARMRQVAALLERGLKDETIARRLGVSVRTMRRLIAATFDELGADSRFQAGVLAERRGWLDHADSE